MVEKLPTTLPSTGEFTGFLNFHLQLTSVTSGGLQSTKLLARKHLSCKNGAQQKPKELISWSCLCIAASNSFWRWLIKRQQQQKNNKKEPEISGDKFTPLHITPCITSFFLGGTGWHLRCLAAIFASMAVWIELRREGLILALLGVMLGLPITQLPQLQQAGFW